MRRPRLRLRRPYIEGHHRGVVYPVVQLRRVSVRCRLSRGHIDFHCWHDDQRPLPNRELVTVLKRCCRCSARDWDYEETPEGKAARDAYYGMPPMAIGRPRR